MGDEANVFRRHGTQEKPIEVSADADLQGEVRIRQVISGGS